MPQSSLQPTLQLSGIGKTIVGNTGLGMTHTKYPTIALMRSLPALGYLSERIKENTFDEPHSATVDSVINPATPFWAEKVKILTASVCPASMVPPERQNARHMLPPMA